MKNIYPKGENPFAGKKIMNFKQVLTYPNDGNLRFRIQLDKNGQVVDINQSLRVLIEEEGKKKHYKIVKGERPRILFDHIKGRPFALSLAWIDDYVLNSMSTLSEDPAEE